MEESGSIANSGDAQPPSLDELTERLIAFRDARDWKQFHTVKNLIVSLALEAAELMEITQWKTDAEVEVAVADPTVKARLEEECADVFLYLLLLAERLDIDLARAGAAKILRNDAKYPVAKSKGNSLKYNEL
jgi:NTP pyrophosphatase (non-canonical NTP hydrolase)